MVIDFAGCWVVEVVCKRLFAVLEPKELITRGQERREKRRRLEEKRAAWGDCSRPTAHEEEKMGGKERRRSLLSSFTSLPRFSYFFLFRSVLCLIVWLFSLLMPLFLLLFVAVVVFYSPHTCISSSSPSSPHIHTTHTPPHLNVSYTLIVEIQISENSVL